ncbi:MAG: hemolysin family protein [Bacteroidota bacterium]|nr:hemolysin family protein [Bacteroidota bacterium]
MEYYYITVVIVSLIFSALFSGVEIAFVSSNKLQIELQNKQGYLSGKILAKFIEQPSRFIGTTLVGNTIALVIYGIFMTYILQPIFEQNLPQVLNNEATILVLQTLISTLIVLLLAEFTPKSFFLINPNWLLTVFAFPMVIIYYLMYPLVFVVVGLSRFMITKVFGLKYSEDKPVFGLTDLNNYIKTNFKIDHAESIIDANTRIFNNALEFKTVRVRECMIPRTDIAAVDIGDDIKVLKEAFIESGHSKILIYQESIDDIVGYCASITLFKKPKEIAGILSPILIVPETMLANELMIQFITEHKSIALVVDEFGGTSGLVTIEDIIEEIFGEIQDEHDVEDWVEQKIDEENYLLSARHEIDFLNKKYNWNLPLGDYDTLGGFILAITENIPKVNDVIEVIPFTFTIMAMQENRIDTVKLTIKSMPDAGM